MTFEEKKKKALALMEEKKMWQSNYAPPLLRLFWKAGGKMPPPPFAPFWRNMLFFAAWFGPLWGVFMWFSTWQSEGYSASDALFASVTAGLFYGAFMALFHAWRKRANKLPDWDRL